MASYNKFNAFVGDILSKVHDLIGTAGTDADTCKVMLVNSPAPAATNSVKADLTEITAGSGYSAGGSSAANSGSNSSGTVTVSGTKVVFTASGGSVGPLRYVVLYNDTPTSPADPLIAWWDYGSSVTLNDGETFSVLFNNSSTTGTIFTLA